MSRDEREGEWRGQRRHNQRNVQHVNISTVSLSLSVLTFSPASSLSKSPHILLSLSYCSISIRILLEYTQVRSCDTHAEFQDKYRESSSVLRCYQRDLNEARQFMHVLSLLNKFSTCRVFVNIKY